MTAPRHRAQRDSALPAVTLGLLVWCACSPPVGAQSAKVPTGLGCAFERQDHYLCNADAFRARLARARTVRIDTGRMDLFAAQQMHTLVESLGKQVSAPESKPDLIFDLSPVDRGGRIEYGPGDVALATLSVYDPAQGTGRRGLIWVDTFDGQEDRPWPSVVVDTIRSFDHHTQPH